jgi:1-acyl-sn-glycerol-3-phosphate acyltransferase
VPLVGVSFNRTLIFMTKKELFRFRLIGYFVRSLGGFPIYREQLDRKALRQANRVLADGQALFIFPEGTRSRGGQLGPAFPGTALVALRSGATILPVAITGTEKLRTDRLRGATWLLRRPRIKVTIGRPFHLPPVNGRLTKSKRTELTNLIMGRIVELLPLERRGHYAQQGKLDDVKD